LLNFGIPRFIIGSYHRNSSGDIHRSVHIRIESISVGA
jgi:hypothetical protein